LITYQHKKNKINTIKYYRSSNQFIIGITGNKETALYISKTIQYFIKSRLNLKLKKKEISKKFNFLGYFLKIKTNIKKKKIKIPFQNVKNTNLLLQKKNLNTPYYNNNKIIKINNIYIYTPIKNIVKKLQKKNLLNIRKEPIYCDNLLKKNTSQITKNFILLIKKLIIYYTCTDNFLKLKKLILKKIKKSLFFTLKKKTPFVTYKNYFYNSRTFPFLKLKKTFLK
jgi:hypothetical protein